MRPPEFIETERLRLRPASLDDAVAIYEGNARDPEVTRYLVFRTHGNIEETRTFLKRCEQVWANGDAFPYAITLKPTGALIGMIEIQLKNHMADLGYALARPYWGQGFATEATAAVVNWALSQPTVYRVWAVCDVDNPASARVMEKAGMTYEGLLRRFVLHPNVSDEPRDALCYAAIK